MSILFYKRPEFVPERDGPLSHYASKGGNGRDCSAAIPPELSFDNIVCNKTSPPCGLQDLLNYLIYVTHDAENLQFYLWMIDYFQRFRHATKEEQALSPRWKRGQLPPNGPNAKIPDKALSSLGIRDLDIHSEDISNGSTWDATETEFTDDYTQTVDSLKPSTPLVKQHVYSGVVQLRTNPHIQPFRGEINRIISHYLLPGGPRQLNLSHNDRATVLRALKHTTHPSALRPVKRMLDSILRNQCHPNFVRWSICNGNKPWTYSLRIFAILNIVIGFGVAVALTLSGWSRWWRAFAAIEWWFGITSIIAASQGLCVLQHRLHTRQCHAWETEDCTDRDDEAMLKGLDIKFVHHESPRSKWPVKMEVFGPGNNYSGETWMNSHGGKIWFQKLFEKRVIVRDSGLKQIQNRIIWQAEAWALLITIVLTAGFVAIPKGSLYP